MTKKDRDKQLKIIARRDFVSTILAMMAIASFMMVAHWGTGLFIVALFFGVIAALVGTSFGDGLRQSNGNRAVKTTLEVLKKLPKEYHIYEYVNVSMDKKSTELDVVVLGRNGLFYIDAWGVSGLVSGGDDDKEWHVNSHYQTNPIKKIKWQVHLLSSVFKQEGLKGYIDGILHAASKVTMTDEVTLPFFDSTNSKDMIKFITDKKGNITDDNIKKIDKWLSRNGTKIR